MTDETQHDLALSASTHVAALSARPRADLEREVRPPDVARARVHNDLKLER
jgi:hypothetical protein